MRSVDFNFVRPKNPPVLRLSLNTLQGPHAGLPMFPTARFTDAMPTAFETTADPIVCRCLGISEAEIKTAADVSVETPTVRCIMQMTGAGSGCTACHRRIRQLLTERRVAELALANQCPAPSSSPTCVTM